MSELKLFRILPDGVAQLSGGGIALEKSLQQVFEQHLHTLLGVRFLASEFTRDTTGIGHFGTGDLEISIAQAADLERAKPLLDRAYNES